MNCKRLDSKKKFHSLVFVLPLKLIFLQVLLCWFNAVRGVLYGCGDLIFSSHMIFTLVFVRSYQKYGTQRYLSIDNTFGLGAAMRTCKLLCFVHYYRFIKQLAWLLAVTQSLLIIASRKHYTVDVVVAW